jgi:hypothetical protein
MATRKPSKRIKTSSQSASAGKENQIPVAGSEIISVEQATREFLARDEELAQASKRRLEAARKAGSAASRKPEH